MDTQGGVVRVVSLTIVWLGERCFFNRGLKAHCIHHVSVKSDQNKYYSSMPKVQPRIGEAATLGGGLNTGAS